jgi:uracil-DNA glycosylase family 4
MTRSKDKAQQLQDIRDRLEKDLPSLPLGNTDEQTVPGDGNPEAEIVFIGEAPGYYESVQRKPFVGRSGQFFIKTLTEVGYPRGTVYITNIVKVRPPDNRDPLPDEIRAYKPYLDEEIEVIQPVVIITLGRFSMAKFLPTVKISQVHGRLHKVNWNSGCVFVLPMYHPAAALRNPKMAESFVADFQKIPKVIEWIKTKGQDLLKEEVENQEFEASVKNALFSETDTA